MAVKPAPAAADGFSARLRAAVGDATLRTFALRAGISTTALHQYLTGKSEPSRPVLLALARAAGRSVGWLAGGEESPFTVCESAPPYLPSPEKQAGPAGLDPVVLESVLAAIEPILQKQQVTLPAEKKSRLTTLAYEDAWRRGGAVSREYVAKLVELAK